MRTACARPAKLRRRRAGIDRIDVGAPALQLLAPRLARPGIVGDVVDGAAERIDFEHRLALRRAAESACRDRTSCRRRARRPGTAGSPTHPAAFAARRSSAGRAAATRRRCMPAMVSPATAGMDRCTRSLQRIARHQHARQPMRQRVDDRDFEAEPPIVDQDGERHRSRSAAARCARQARAGNRAAPATRAARRAPRHSCPHAASASSGT